MSRRVYLEDIALEEARRRFEDALAAVGIGRIEAETVPVGEAIGRVTAAPVVSRAIDSGPAVHSRATSCRRVSSPNAANTGAEAASPAVLPGRAALVMGRGRRPRPPA